MSMTYVLEEQNIKKSIIEVNIAMKNNFNFRKISVFVISMFVMGTQLTLSAENVDKSMSPIKQKVESIIIDTTTFDKWILGDVELRKDSDNYVNIECGTITITSTFDKPVRFIHTPPILCTIDNQVVEFIFKAEGSGQGQIGFLVYEDEKWTQTDGWKIESFALETEVKAHKFTLSVKGDKMKTLRVFISAAPNSKVKFSDLKIDIK